MLNLVKKIFNLLNKVFKTQKDKAPAMSYDLVASTATCINALSISDVSAEYVTMVLKAQGWKFDKRVVIKYFNEWTESEEGNKAVDRKELIFDFYFSERVVYENAPEKGEELLRKTIDKKLGSFKFEEGAYCAYERFNLPDPKTEKYVFQFNRRIFPLYTMLIMQGWYEEKHKDLEPIRALEPTYQPVNFPMMMD